MDNTYESIDEQNPNKKRKMLIVFLHVTFDMLSNKNFSQ